jgi:TRAP-type C4-dicarboxylate transport system substrate-binding protein
MIAKCKCMGSGDNAKFDIMGLNSVFVVPSETYDALQRGICDTANCALAAVYAMSWDEVAPNVMLNGLIAAGSCYTINLDFWNKLSQGQQQIIREAALRTGSYSVEVQNSQEDTMISTIEERSNKKIKRLSEEDVLKYYGYQFESNAANCLNRVAGDAEKTANMTKLLQKTADYYGYDWTPPES